MCYARLYFRVGWPISSAACSVGLTKPFQKVFNIDVTHSADVTTNSERLWWHAPNAHGKPQGLKGLHGLPAAVRPCVCRINGTSNVNIEYLPKGFILAWNHLKFGQNFLATLYIVHLRVKGLLCSFSEILVKSNTVFVVVCFIHTIVKYCIKKTFKVDNELMLTANTLSFVSYN